ncbi:MAG: hypothetical protein IEMM0002_1265 [bacterium]|nr:MAG: hypothetical protein IEMM0002_1265 [bacterium]
MIGVLLTSTCYYDGIDKKTFSERVQELLDSILSLKRRIRTPYELIIADNSPPDRVPTEKILEFCPAHTLFIRSTHNPGKTVGEATLIRDGVYLSHARGHKWLLKLTGRYRLDGDWVLDDAIKQLEDKRKPMYLHLIGKTMKEMPWAKGHPCYAKNLDNEKILMGVATQAFIVDPRYLAKSGALEKNFLYREIEWVNCEQTFWRAVKGLDFLHWPDLPISGSVENKNSNVSVKTALESVSNPIFESTDNFSELPCIDISPLIAAAQK